MSNQLKLGNQLVLLNGYPIQMPTDASDPGSPVQADLYFNTTSNVLRLYNGSAWVSLGTGSGTVTSVSVVSANGLAGTVATATTTPALTLSTTITGILQGNGTAISAATTTGSGSVVLSTSPTLVTPALGTPSAIVLTNGTGLPLTTGVTGTLPIANGGTNATTANTAFNNLSPMTTAGDIIYENATPIAARLAIGSTGQVLTVSGGLPVWATPATSGTVTSVALADGSSTPIYTISGSPVTSSGTLTFTLNTESANTVFAGPTSGGAAQPTFRSLVAADIPSLAYANQALSNLASVAINTALLPGTTATLDIGSTTKVFVAVHAASLTAQTTDATITTNLTNGNVKLIANGTGNLIEQATIRQISGSAASTSYKEEQYFDSETLAAGTVAFTTIPDYSFATANFRGALVEYTIRETTSDKQRTGKMMISTDGTLVGFEDSFVETAVLGSALGLKFQAVITGANLEIQYNDTDATNTCTMRAEITRYRA